MPPAAAARLQFLSAERELDGHLARGPLLPVYLVTSGDIADDRGRNEERPTADPAALREAAQRIEAVALAGGDPSLDRIHIDYLDGDHDGFGHIHNLIAHELRTLSLFGGKRVVTVLHADALAFGDGEAKGKRKAKVAGEDPLEKLMAGLGADGDARGGASRGGSGGRLPFVLIVVAERFDRRKRAWKVLGGAGAVVEVAPLTVPSLQSYLEAQAAPHGIHIERGAAQRVWDRLGGADAARLRTTADRLLLDAGPRGKVTVERVEETVPLDRDAAMWAVTDAIANGDLARVLTVLHMVVDPSEGFEADVQRLCGFLNSHYLLLAQAHALVQGGRSDGQATDALGVHPFRAQNLLRQLRAMPPGRIEGALRALDSLDQVRKSSTLGGRVGVLRWLEQLAVALVRGVPLRLPPPMTPVASL
ncbi:MAG: hypothetical protein EXR79_16420 [Myxococcales bacterium]|nr:hypothetical protein [Myxococcales bacterium]